MAFGLLIRIGNGTAYTAGGGGPYYTYYLLSYLLTIWFEEFNILSNLTQSLSNTPPDEPTATTACTLGVGDFAGDYP